MVARRRLEIHPRRLSVCRSAFGKSFLSRCHVFVSKPSLEEQKRSSSSRSRMPLQECIQSLRWRGIDVRLLRSSARKSGQETTSLPLLWRWSASAASSPWGSGCEVRREKFLSLNCICCVSLMQAPAGGRGHSLTLFSASAPGDGQGRRWVDFASLTLFLSCPLTVVFELMAAGCCCFVANKTQLGRDSFFSSHTWLLAK